MTAQARYQTPAHLLVICYKCLRQDKVLGDSEEMAARIAWHLGWRLDLKGSVCRKCPGGGKRDGIAAQFERKGIQIDGPPEISQ